jgi:hypothetical protein
MSDNYTYWKHLIFWRQNHLEGIQLYRGKGRNSYSNQWFGFGSLGGHKWQWIHAT